MRPPVVDPECPSPGEIRLFESLRDDPATRGWTVLHSLGISQHVRQVVGEADFVAVIPGKGVLCIEVKSHRRVRREGGAWYLGGEPVDYRGPFRQAQEACESIRARVARENPHLRSIPFGWVVVFTHVELVEQIRSGEWLPCQMLTSDQIWHDQGVGHVLELALEGWLRNLESSESARWYDRDRHLPKASQIPELVKILRPDFEICESAASAAGKLADELRRYTAEQFVALDAVEVNKRVLFTGPAGTGKTLLALEAARRLEAKGQRVALVCFNRLLGRWLADQASSSGGVQFAGTIDRLLMDVLNVNHIPREAFARLPKDALERLTAPDCQYQQFDAIIVDEAQDVFPEDRGYRDVLDALLREGLSDGKWCVFGDFEKQALFAGEAQAQEAIEWLTGDVGRQRVARIPLSVNCRNTPRISEFVKLLGRPGMPYSRVLRPDDGFDARCKFWANRQDQVSQLGKVLEDLFQEGYHPHDIVVLSATTANSSAAKELASVPSAPRVAPFDNNALDFLTRLGDGGSQAQFDGMDGAGEDPRGAVFYTTIAKFKGLESRVVVLTDFEEISTEKASSLLYTGITRATDRLFVLADESAAEEFQRIVEQAALSGR